MIILKCDTCSETIESKKGMTMTLLRRVAIARGWRNNRTTGGADLCDECAWEQHHAVGGKLTTCKRKS